MSELLNLLIYSFLVFIPGGILLLLLTLKRKSVIPLIAGGYLFIAVTVSVLALIGPRILGFHYFQWNWEGKILDFLWPFAVVYLFGWLKANEVGIRMPNQKSGWWASYHIWSLFCIFECDDSPN